MSATDVDFSALFLQARRSGAVGATSQRADAAAKRSGGGGQTQRPNAAANATIAEGSVSKKRKKRKKGRPAPERPEAAAAAAAAGSSQPAPSRPAAAAKPTGRGRGELQAQLAGARFRDINEQLYTRDSAHAVALFGAQPELFHAYHEGFRLQALRRVRDASNTPRRRLKTPPPPERCLTHTPPLSLGRQAAGWPLRPVDAILGWLRGKPAAWVVADVGCGDAEIAARAPQKVLSFDLVASQPHVTACDAAALPVRDSSVHAAVYCLALMGSNYVQFLREARRILRPRGHLRIAEVKSRFGDTEEWLAMMRDALGFQLVDRDDSNSHFVLFGFRKGEIKGEGAAPAAPPAVPLKPCLYKRR